MIALNIGCGLVKQEGEIGVDIAKTIVTDVVASILALPFQSDSVDFVRAEHVLEHLPMRFVPLAIWEVRRVLKLGGVVQVGVPDMANLCERYLAARTSTEKAHVLRALYGSGAHAGEHHMSGWDEETLTDLLKSVGFQGLEQETDVPRYVGVSSGMHVAPQRCILVRGTKA